MSVVSARQMLRIADVCKLVSLSKTTIYDRLARGKFPRPVRFTRTLNLWVLSEVEAWVDEQIAARDGAA